MAEPHEKSDGPRLGESAREALDALRERYPTSEALLLPALHLAQKQWDGWSYDARADVVITPELQAEIDELRQRAEDDPTQAAVIGNEIATLVSAAQATSGPVKASPSLARMATVPR